MSNAAPGPDVAQIRAFLKDELPYLWRDSYVDFTPRPTSILRMSDNDFTYIFDWYSALVEPGQVVAAATSEDRLGGACDLSRIASTNRNVSRQRGWVGPTEKHFDSDRDKGHFIPHTLGGGLEINLFVQMRDLNRGWARSGKVYRSMEGYGQKHPGTFFFNRPLYADGSARPAMLEFGILKADGELWVERFEN